MTTPSFGKYVVVKPLGRGGMAEVYLARDPGLDRQVAIKVIFPHLAGDPAFGERFRREAKLVASLRHPHIVQLYDFDIQNDQSYMVMEFLDGGSLKTRLDALRQTGKTLPLAEAARVLDAIASALDYAHQRGAIHRDVKPGNIIFTSSNEPVLTDFGIAKIVGEAAQLSASGSIVGSPAYMSPEQAASKPVDARSDLYALGVVLYEMTTGRVPFQGDAPTAVLMQHLNNPPPAPRQFNANIPDAVQAVILRALAKNPAERFASAQEMANAFRAALTGAMPAEPAISTNEQTLVDENASPAKPARVAPPRSSPIELTQRRQRWLGHLSALAEIFAPLVGRSAPEIQTQDRRSLIATILGIIGILFAALQFLASFIDLVQRPIAPLIAAFPYIIAALFIGSIALSLYALVRSPANRKRAFSVLAFIAIAGMAWGAWTFANRVKPVSTFVVLVADFEKRGNQQADIAYAISRTLAQNIGDATSVVSIERANQVIGDAAQARALGAERKATMVIWGKYDDRRVYPSVELLKIPNLAREAVSVPVILQTAADGLGLPVAPSARDVTQSLNAPVTLAQISFDAKTEDQAADLSTALLGVAFYANGDPARAKELLDKGLARLEPNKNDIAGLESIYFQRASVLYGLGQIADAVNDLQQSLKLKDTFEARYNLAIAYSESCAPARQLDRAIAEAEKAAQAKSNNASAHRLLADLYRQAGNYLRASDELQAALKIDANDAATYQMLAQVQQAQGQTDAAKKSQQSAATLYQKLLTTMPADASLNNRLARGDALMNIADYKGALAEYQTAQKIAPNDPRVYRGLGNAYYHSGDVASSVDAYETWVKLSPNDAGARILLGLVDVELRRTPSAIEQLQKATALSPCAADAYATLGSLYYQLNDEAKALEAYQAAAKADPQNADAFYMVGILNYLREQYAPAAQALETAVALRPDNITAHFALGTVYYFQNNFPKALAERETVVKLAPTEATYYESLAYAYERLNRLDEAVAAYQKSIVLKDTSQARMFLGMVLTRQQKYADALTHLQQAIKLDETNFLAYGALGDVYAAQRKWDDAVAAYQTSLQRKDVAATRMQLASAYLAQGKTDLAIGEYQKASALEPKNDQIQTMLGNVYASLGKFDDAVKAFRAAIAAKADSIDAYLAIAGVEYKRCNLSAATQAASTAATFNAPNQVRARGFLAAMYEAQGRTSDAEKIYNDLRNAPATDVVAHLLAGEYLNRAGKSSDAMREFQIVLEAGNLVPLFASVAHYDLAQVYLAQDKLIPAEQELTAALAAYPTNALAQGRLGDVALRKGEVAGALKAYEQAQSLLPAFAQIDAETAATLNVSLALGRGLALNRQNKPGDAAAAFDAALASAQKIAGVTPQSPSVRFVSGYVYLVRGETAKADAEFAAALQCDQALAGARARVASELAKYK